MDEDDFMSEAEWAYWEDFSLADDEDEDEYDIVELGDAFRDVLHDDYAELSPEDTDQALLEVFEALSPAESFSFANALSQVQKGAVGAAKSPTFQQLAGTALPVVGTAFGGPVGGTLAGAAGQALIGRPPAAPAPAAAAVMAPAAPVAAAAPAAPAASAARAASALGALLPPGTAAKKALVASYLPAVQQALVANALREHGSQTVNGIPVPMVMKMFGALLGEAIAEAEAEDLMEGEEQEDSPFDDHQGLYDALVELEDQDLCDAAGLL